MKKSQFWHTALSNTIIGILFLLFFISLGLTAAIYIRPFYYVNIQDISTDTGYSVTEIKANYDALIDWCSPFAKGRLSFPTLPSSENGISHFEEVKVIFNLFFAALCISPAFLAKLIYQQEKLRNYSYLLASPIIMCVLPLIVAGACAIDFNSVFVLFHNIVFRNDDWLFSPAADPIILFLPESFFLKCALIIVGVVLLGSAVLMTVYLFRKKSEKSTL